MTSTIIIIRRRGGTVGGGFTGPIDSSGIIDESVQAIDLAPMSVTDEKIATVAANKITGALTNATIHGSAIEDGTVNASTKLQTGSVTLDRLSAEILGQLGIPDRSVAATKLASPIGGTLNMGGSEVLFTTPHRQFIVLPGAAGSGTQTDAHYFRTPASAGFAWYRGGSHSNNQYDPGPGGTLLLRLDTDGNLTAKGDLLTLSDERLKTDVQVIRRALDKLTGIRGCTFTLEGRRAAGVIAQDVEKVLPEAVHTLHDNSLSVAYPQLLGLVVEAVKELDRKVERLSSAFFGTGF